MAELAARIIGCKCLLPVVVLIHLHGMVVFSAAKSSITLECLLRHPFGTEILMAEVVFEQ